MNIGKFGKTSGINFNAFTSGLKKESLKTDAQKSIFDTIDKDKNGVIDEDELNNFKKALDSSGDSQISKSEAKAYLKNNGLEEMDKEEVLSFLQGSVDGLDAEDIKAAEKGNVDGREAVTISYNNGDKEVVFNDDNSSRLTSTNAETGDVTTLERRPDKTTETSTVVKENGDTVTTNFAEDGTTPLKEVSTFTETGSTETVTYEDGTPSTKDVSRGTTESHYSYDENGQEVLESKVENKGHDVLEKSTTYSYGEDGTITENITQAGGKNTVRETRDGKVLSETVSTPGQQVSTQYDDNGKIKTQTTIKGESAENYNTKNEVTYNEDGGRTEVFTQPSKNFTQTNVYNAEGNSGSKRRNIHGKI